MHNRLIYCITLILLGSVFLNINHLKGLDAIDVTGGFPLLLEGSGAVTGDIVIPSSQSGGFCNMASPSLIVIKGSNAILCVGPTPYPVQALPTGLISSVLGAVAGDTNEDGKVLIVFVISYYILLLLLLLYTYIYIYIYIIIIIIIIIIIMY